MNRASAPIARLEPGRYLGCLAYFWCANAPHFPLGGNVVPYLASDRTQYYDKSFRAEDLDLMSRWGSSGVKAFGIWEYAYGSGYVIPREPVGVLADGIGRPSNAAPADTSVRSDRIKNSMLSRHGRSHGSFGIQAFRSWAWRTIFLKDSTDPRKNRCTVSSGNAKHFGWNRTDRRFGSNTTDKRTKPSFFPPRRAID